MASDLWRLDGRTISARWVVAPIVSALLLLFIKQEASADPWLAAENARKTSTLPPEVSLTISAPEKEYYPGELMPVTLTYRNDGAAPVRVEKETPGLSQPVRWIAVGPDDKAVPDVRSHRNDPKSFVGAEPEPAHLAQGNTYSESLDLSQVLWLGTPGTYEIVAISTRAFTGQRSHAYPAGSRQQLVSNHLKVRVRNARPGEIQALVTRYEPMLSSYCADDARRPYAAVPPEVAEAAARIAAVHSLDALPIYLRHLSCTGISQKMEDAIYGIPDTSATLSVLRARVADPQHPISYEERSIFGKLLQKQEGSEPSMFDIEGERELLNIARNKTGQAQLVTSLTLLHGIVKPGLADDLARHASEFPEGMRPTLLSQLQNRVSTSSASSLVPLLDSPNEFERSSALESLIRIGGDRYLDMALADMVSTESRFRVHLWKRSLPHPLTEAQQLTLAIGLADGPKPGMHSALSLLEEEANSKAVVAPLRQALSWAQGYENVRERGEVLSVLSHVDPAGTRNEALQFLREHNDHAFAESHMFRSYSSDPDFQTYNPDTHSHSSPSDGVTGRSR